VAESRVRSATAVIQNAAAFTRGKAMWRAPIWLGRMRLPKPPWGAVVSTKKTISVPWKVTNAR
jgi:hypothetical protein